MWEKEDRRNLKGMLEKLDGLEDEAERERYKSLLTDWYEQDRNKERSHGRKRDSRSFDSLENLAASEKEKRRTSLGSKLCQYEEFEDVIFSESPDDLHELVTDGVLSRIVKGLTPAQKEVLHLVAVQRYTTVETAGLLDVSERNVRKLYATALYHIRGQIYPIIKFRRKLETEEKYQDMARERGICTTYTERKFTDKADKKIRNYYGEMTGEQEKPSGASR